MGVAVERRKTRVNQQNFGYRARQIWSLSIVYTTREARTRSWDAQNLRVVHGPKSVEPENSMQIRPERVILFTDIGAAIRDGQGAVPHVQSLPATHRSPYKCFCYNTKS